MSNVNPRVQARMPSNKKRQDKKRNHTSDLYENEKFATKTLAIAGLVAMPVKMMADIAHIGSDLAAMTSTMGAMLATMQRIERAATKPRGYLE